MPVAEIPYFSSSKRVCIVCGEPAKFLDVTSIAIAHHFDERTGVDFDPPSISISMEGKDYLLRLQNRSVDLCDIKCAGYVDEALAKRLAFLQN